MAIVFVKLLKAFIINNHGPRYHHQVLRGGRTRSRQDLHALPIRPQQLRRKGQAHHRLRLLHQAQMQSGREACASAVVGHRWAGEIQLGVQDVP